MTNPPPSDDLEEQEFLAQQPSEQQEYSQQDSSTLYGNEPYSKEPSGFGFVALVASLISLAVFGGIVIYNLLLAPSAPRQPILIEAEGATKSVPSDAQIKPEPNSDVGVFRMLRGAGKEREKNGSASGNGEEQLLGSSPSRSLSLKAVPRQQAEAGTKVESITSTPELGGARGDDARGNVGSEKPAPQVNSDVAIASEEVDAKNANELEGAGESVAKKEAVQESTEPSEKGSWYVQVAALESRSATDRAWTRLHDKLPELLYTQKYIAKEARLASGKRVWRLLLGPQGQSEASALCRALQLRSQSCIVKRLDK